MVAVTVTLVVVVTPVIFTVSGEAGDTPPESDFAFFYDEAVDEDEEDAFGQTASEVGGTGMVTITYESGASIPVEELQISSGEGQRDLVATEQYESGDQLLPGDRIDVWATRSDDIQIIWTDQSGDSVILDGFSIHPES